MSQVIVGIISALGGAIWICAVLIVFTIVILAAGIIKIMDILKH